MQTVLRFLAIYCLAKRSSIGYSRKNPNRRCWGHTFWKKTPGIFRFVVLPLEIPDKVKLHPLEIPRSCVTPIGISKTKNLGPWNSTQYLLDLPSKFHFFFYWSQEFPHSIYSVPLVILCLQPPCLDFFWNSPI